MIGVYLPTHLPTNPRRNKMKVSESKRNKCDFTLYDISEEEQNLMFLEGLKVLVKEARDGHIGEYVVLPYKDNEVLLVGSKTTTIEISDEDVDALVQIGAVSIITRGMKECTDGNNTNV